MLAYSTLNKSPSFFCCRSLYLIPHPNFLLMLYVNYVFYFAKFYVNFAAYS